MNILLGVSGGIATYKAVDLLRELGRRGVSVQVALTASAQQFVTPLTFATLSGRQVLTNLWTPEIPTDAANPAKFDIEHITLAQTIDALVLAPATANTLARLAHGLADDLLTTVYLATHAPVVLAPAMNVNMWHHPATQANLATLRARGHLIVEPATGDLACGMTGAGRLADTQTIVEAVLSLRRTKDFAQETLLITAGGTREPLDPVRFLGNRSSGKMAHALASAALARGARVLLIAANTEDPPPQGVELIPVQTAAQMHTAVLTHLPRATIVIGAAAVADYRPLAPSPTKLRRAGPLTLTLEPTPDILADSVRRRAPGTLVLAFAAETEPDPTALATLAHAKLLRKGADAIVANDISTPGRGFASDLNAGLFLTPTRTVTLPETTKRAMAETILTELLRLRPNPL